MPASQSSTMRLGIFGGTFDPLHVGHLILAGEALDQLALDKLHWLLTPDPPHKPDREITPIPARVAMLQAAIEENAKFELSRLDIDRPPPHYAVDSLHLYRQRFPQAELIYLMGGDSLGDLPTWHEPRQFIEACDGLGVMRRPGDQVDLSGLEKELPGISEKVSFVDAPLLEISSSIIRERVAAGRHYRYYLPAAVCEIIEHRGLYR
ncbi:MAG: nicotinate-nucleotide adenylyltransferase [Anaerolineales bacterium]